MMKRLAAILGAVLGLTGSGAQAAISWNWSFGSEVGMFITDGSGNPSAGSYTLNDFIVQSSGAGATIGSVGGGQYGTNGFSTSAPYSFNWDGSAVTQWNHAGSNPFKWWVFNQTSNSNKYYLFGWGQGNSNLVDQATYYTDSGQPSDLEQASFTVTVAPSAVPVPGTAVLLSLSLGAMGWVARRKQA
jgi:hypothetical protein